MSEEKKVVAAEEAAQQPAANPMEAVMHDPDAPIITMKKLLEAGAHFGVLLLESADIERCIAV